MKIIVINWESHYIEEYETDSIKWEKDGVSYTTWIGNNHKVINKISYSQFLGIKGE
jgi:hypothetical protein